MAARIRLATPADAAGVAAIYDPICRETPISFELEAPGPAEMGRRMENTLKRLPWLVCVDGEQVLGYAYARPYRERPAYQWTLESSVYVAEGCRGKGVGWGLYTALMRLLEAQGYRQLHAAIALPNEASVRLHEGLGFERLGVFPAVGYKLGAWHDVGFWRRSFTSSTAEPAEPLVLWQVLGTSAWESSIRAGLDRLRL